MDTGIKAAAGTGRAGRIVKTIIFLLLAAAVFARINQLAQPVWTGWNNYNRTAGFYEQPEDTIETIFLGTSVVVNGIIPAELYENYGICSYNLGTEQQPMLASYYWLEETYRLHSETLTTVVVDMSSMRYTQTAAYYRKALDGMQLSSVKLHALKDHADNFSEMISMLIPVFSYHDRWKSLTEEDFEKSSYEPKLYPRGYNATRTMYVDEVSSYTSILVPTYEVNEDAGESNLVKESLEYLMKMIEFCEEHEIRLVLIKTPMLGNWTSQQHNAIQTIADTYGLDFLDFSFSPYIDAIDFNNATDTSDGQHMNYYGASKLTDYLGAYLTEECGNADRRGDESYAFMEDELEEYLASLATYNENHEVTDLEAELEADLEAGVAFEDMTDSEQKLYQYNLACEEKKQSLSETEEESGETEESGEAEETGETEEIGETGDD